MCATGTKSWRWTSVNEVHLADRLATLSVRLMARMVPPIQELALSHRTALFSYAEEKTASRSDLFTRLGHPFIGICRMSL